MGELDEGGEVPEGGVVGLVARAPAVPMGRDSMGGGRGKVRRPTGSGLRPLWPPGAGSPPPTVT